MRADAILSNPPYIAGTAARSRRRSRRTEPPGALFAGADGLDVIRRLVPAAAVALSPGGLLAIEHGAGQAGAVRALLVRAGFDDVRSHRDPRGSRVCAGRRQGGSAASGS